VKIIKEGLSFFPLSNGVVPKGRRGLRGFFPFSKELLLGWHGVERGRGRFHPFFFPFFIKGMKGVFVRVGLRIF